MSSTLLCPPPPYLTHVYTTIFFFNFWLHSFQQSEAAVREIADQLEGAVASQNESRENLKMALARLRKENRDIHQKYVEICRRLQALDSGKQYSEEGVGFFDLMKKSFK